MSTLMDVVYAIQSLVVPMFSNFHSYNPVQDLSNMWMVFGGMLILGGLYHGNKAWSTY